MGVQRVKDVTLIRHTYVATAQRSKGMGGILLDHLLKQIKGPILVGTWAAATWAIRFYEKHGFRQVTFAEKDRCDGHHLLRLLMPLRGAISRLPLLLRR